MRNETRSIEIVRPLGSGGMATVHLALLREGTRRRVVAIKTPHAFVVENPACATLLENEARLAARIRHPNVVAVLDYFGPRQSTNIDAPVLVMEWVDGIDLAKLVRAASDLGRRVPPDVAAAIACDVVAGLHAAHECVHDDGSPLDVVHRDVSPQNVLVGFDGIARVTDFGIAKVAWRSGRTQTGSIKGKLGYLAPELLAGRCDRRADVFGAGVVLWELLTGMRLRSAEGIAVLVDILYGYVDRPSVHAPEAARLDEVVMRALEPSPDDRFSSAAEMRTAIEGAIRPADRRRVRQFVDEVLRASDAPSTDADEVTLVKHAA